MIPNFLDPDLKEDSPPLVILECRETNVFVQIQIAGMAERVSASSETRVHVRREGGGCYVYTFAGGGGFGQVTCGVNKNPPRKRTGRVFCLGGPAAKQHIQYCASVERQVIVRETLPEPEL